MSIKYEINPAFIHLESYIRDLPTMFDTVGQLIYDARNQVRILELDGLRMVAKRFKRPMLHQRIDYTFIRPSKARRAYTYGLRFLELGISTPQPIAYIETYGHGLYTDGYLVTAYCPDSDMRLLREESDSHPELVTALMTFIVDMHCKGCLHGDTNLSNFLYHADKESPTGYALTTIDINRSHFIPQPTPHQCLCSLMRLTHQRPLLTMLVEQYAVIRGWNTESSVNAVMRCLDRFEKTKRLKKKYINRLHFI